MAKQKKQRYEGVVYSTADDFEYQEDETHQAETLPNSEQKLKVGLDKKARKGKIVTLVTGFIGTDEDLASLRSEERRVGKECRAPWTRAEREEGGGGAGARGSAGQGG